MLLFSNLLICNYCSLLFHSHAFLVYIRLDFLRTHKVFLKKQYHIKPHREAQHEVHRPVKNTKVLLNMLKSALSC